METAPDRCFLRHGRQVYAQGQVLLTLQYLLVTILTTGCTYALVYVLFVYLYCPINLLHACVSQVFFNTCMRGWEGVGSGVFSSMSMVGACCWRGGLCFSRRRDRSFVLYVFVFLLVLSWWVGACLYTGIRTRRLLWYLMWAQMWDGHLESRKNRWTNARYICRLYMCTKSNCVYVCWAAGFDDLGQLLFFF